MKSWLALNAAPASCFCRGALGRVRHSVLLPGGLHFLLVVGEGSLQAQKDLGRSLEHRLRLRLVDLRDVLAYVVVPPAPQNGLSGLGSFTARHMRS